MNVIPLNYKGQFVRFNTEGWINATDIAERFGKRLDHWLSNAETLEYVRTLDEVYSGAPSENLHTRKYGYVKTSKVRKDRGGSSWLHPKLPVAFSRWCDPKFSIWRDLHIYSLLRDELTEQQMLSKLAAFKMTANQKPVTGRERLLAGDGISQSLKPMLSSGANNCG